MAAAAPRLSSPAAFWQYPPSAGEVASRSHFSERTQQYDVWYDIVMNTAGMLESQSVDNMTSLTPNCPAT